MEHGGVRQREGAAKWVGQLLSEGERLVNVLQRLVRVAEMPEGMGRKATAERTEVAGKSGAQAHVVVLFSFVQSEALFQMHARWHQLPLEEQGLSKRPVCYQTQRGVGFALGQGEELIADITRRL